jgi:hypothetical protein
VAAPAAALYVRVRTPVRSAAAPVRPIAGHVESQGFLRLIKRARKGLSARAFDLSQINAANWGMRDKTA